MAGPGDSIRVRTKVFARVFERCGLGYKTIVEMLVDPSGTDAERVSLAVSHVEGVCATVGAALAVSDTRLFSAQALEAQATIRMYVSSLRHLASYVRTQNANELGAAERGYSEARSEDLLTERAINGRRAAHGIAPLPLAENRFLTFGARATDGLMT